MHMFSTLCKVFLLGRFRCVFRKIICIYWRGVILNHPCFQPSPNVKNHPSHRKHVVFFYSDLYEIKKFKQTINLILYFERSFIRFDSFQLNLIKLARWGVIKIITGGLAQAEPLWDAFLYSNWRGCCQL